MFSKIIEGFPSWHKQAQEYQLPFFFLFLQLSNVQQVASL